jgi:hypothetical protein
LLLQLYLAKKPLFAAPLVELERGSMVMGRQVRFLFFAADAEYEGNWARDRMAPGDIARGTDAVQPDRDFRLRCIEGKIKSLRGYEWAQERRAEDLTEFAGQVHMHVVVLSKALELKQHTIRHASKNRQRPDVPIQLREALYQPGKPDRHMFCIRWRYHDTNTFPSEQSKARLHLLNNVRDSGTIDDQTSC